MSIVIPPGQSRTGVALSDGGARRSGQRLRRSRPLASLTVLSYWATTGAVGITAWLASQRDTMWAAALDSERRTGDTTAIAAAGRALLAWRISWVVVGLALVATVLWTLVLARNARTRGVPNVRAGRAAAAWCVPLFGPPAAIRQIGRLLRELDYSERRLWFWLFGFYVHTAVMLVGQVVNAIGFATSIDDPDSLDLLRRQTQVLWLQAGMSGVLTLLAMRAIMHADRAVTGISPRAERIATA